MTRALSIAFPVVIALAGCSSTPRPPDAPRPGTEPRLVVLLVIDQWPEWSFEVKRPELTRGFARLLREGEWHVGEYPSAATLTAPGHALLGTGEPPYRSGIIANEWWHRDLEKQLKVVEDENGGVTAKRLRARTLADAIVAAGTGGKAVSVSLKDRAAIMPVGPRGRAIWYDHKRVTWTSLHPTPWLARWNAAHPIAPRLGEVWTPLAETPALAGIPDDAPGEVGEKGLGPVFPHAIAKASDPAEALIATPFGNELVFDIAIAAISEEQLGSDAAADLLVVSLSASDYVGHGWGHESWESWDMMLRLDRRLDRFLADLDAKIGAGRWAMIATSDHGAAPMPEQGDGGRISYQQIKDAANRAAIAELGPGEWIASARYPTLYLTAAARAQKPRELTIATTKIVYALRSFPGIERVEKSAELWGDCERRTGDALALCAALDPERSGEVMYLPAKGWVVFDATDAVATNHGSMQPYDRLVPVVVLPPGRAPHAPLTRPAAETMSMTRVATILARWLGVTPPSSLP